MGCVYVDVCVVCVYGWFVDRRVLCMCMGRCKLGGCKRDAVEGGREVYVCTAVLAKREWRRVVGLRGSALRGEMREEMRGYGIACTACCSHLTTTLLHHYYTINAWYAVPTVCSCGL
jgi:hypothetical protein